MGIQGLLPLLKPAHEWKDISEYRGLTLAVDAYVWLHKGAFGCAEDLVMGKKTTKFVQYCMHRVRMMRYHGVAPYVVFDGGPLPAKAGTEAERLAKREAAKAKAVELKQGGFTKEAHQAFTACVDVTPEMALQFIKALRAEGVQYVVAPYEADAQLRFLEQHNHVDGLITEDSDLLVFGARRVLFKMDSDGKVCEVDRDRMGFAAAGGAQGGVGRSEWRLDGWGDTEFRHMAILSGCDYLPSVPGVGLKTAHALLRRFKTVDRVLQHLRLEGYPVPKEYKDVFRLAELAFCHQRVWDPELKRLVPLTPTPEGFGEVEDNYIGPDIDPSIAAEIAAGDRCPITKALIVDSWTDFKPIAGPAMRVLPAGTAPNKGAQRKIDDMFKLAPKTSQPANTLRRANSAPNARKTTNAETRATQVLHRYAFDAAGRPPASGPARLSQLSPEKASQAKRMMAAVDCVPESQVLEESGLPPRAGGASSRFFGRMRTQKLGKASSDEPKASTSLLTDEVAPSLCGQLGSRTTSFVDLLSEAPHPHAGGSSASSSALSLTNYPTASARDGSPSPVKHSAPLFAGPVDDLLSSPAPARTRSPVRGVSVSSGYISSSPARAEDSRRRTGGGGVNRLAHLPPAKEEQEQERDDSAPSSDMTVHALDLREICHSPEEALSPTRAARAQLAFVPLPRPDKPKGNVRDGIAPLSDSSNIRSDDDDDDGDGEEAERVKEAARGKKIASIAQGWKEKFSMRKGGRHSLPGLAFTPPASTFTPPARARPPAAATAPRPLGRPPAAGTFPSLARDTPRSVMCPPKFDFAPQPSAGPAGGEEKENARSHTPPPSLPAVAKKRKSVDPADHPVSPLRDAAFTRASRPSKRASLGSPSKVGWASSSPSKRSSQEDGLAPISSGSRSKLERLRFRPHQ